MSGLTNNRWLRWSLTAIAGLLAVIAIELSAVTRPLMPSAHAQIPDSGLQRNQLLELQRETNSKLDSILQLLRTQTIKVKVVGTDKETKSTATSKPRAVDKK